MMEREFLPNHLNHLHEEYTDLYEKLIVEEDKPTYFTVGQSYEEVPARKLHCKLCGNEKFIVGTGSYFTAISCERCGWEICIHEG